MLKEFFESSCRLFEPYVDGCLVIYEFEGLLGYSHVAYKLDKNIKTFLSRAPSEPKD